MIYQHYKTKNKKLWIIYLSFFIGILLHIIPISSQIWHYHPSWTMMLLIYWTAIYPNKINIGTGFILGLITDFIFETILGICALSLSVLSYLTIRKIYYFKYMSIWKQSCIIALFSFLNHSIKILSKFFITKIWYVPEIFWNCILDGSSWPILILIMHKIHYYKNN